ncbi:SUPPRESSOR OF AUXIN RESISTANCE1 isoform X2 [Wolffia australiana]
MDSPAIDGAEVPISGGDKVRWIEISVPSSRQRSSPAIHASRSSNDAAGCHFIDGDRPAYLFWRIHCSVPNVIEVLELCPSKEYPESGLKLVFPEPLFAFSFICRDESFDRAGRRYLLYALTASGIAYVLKLGEVSSYVSGSVISQSDYVEFDVQKDSNVTAVAAIFGCLLLGRQDGLISCYKLGLLDQSSPGFTFELRDDVGIGRLWSLVSRGRSASTVKDLTLSQISSRKMAFVLHSDGLFRVWDLVNYSKVLQHAVTVQDGTGYLPSKIWAGDPNYETSIIPVAVHYESMMAGASMIGVHFIHFTEGEKLALSFHQFVQRFPLGQGVLIDLKITSGKLYILKENESKFYDLLHSDVRMEHTGSYILQENFISDLLFQDPEQLSDDLLWSEDSFFASQDQAPYILSSIFLSRLLQPGVHQSNALRATILDYRKNLTDHAFQTLSVSDLRKELFSIIDSEGLSANLISMFRFWKNFSARYIQHWNEANRPYSLFLDSFAGTVGLVRKASISVLRNREHLELLSHSSFNGLHQISFSSDLERDITLMVLRSIGKIGKQLGRASYAAMLMSLTSPEHFSFEDISSYLLKVLESGYFTPVGPIPTSRERQLVKHRSHRRFSVEMALSLHELLALASSWGSVLDAVENYLLQLVPKKIQSTNLKTSFSVNSCILIQATSQMATWMLDVLFNMLLFLRYLVNAGVQADLMQNDVSRIRQNLLPRVEDIIINWLSIYFVTTTTTESPPVEDFSSRLSSLRIGSKKDSGTWKGKLGTSDITLACLLDFSVSSEGYGFVLSSSLPPPGQFFNLVMDFACRIIRGKEVGSYSMGCAIVLASNMLSHGQHEAAEVLLGMADVQSRLRKDSKSDWCSHDEWVASLHLLGFCIILRAHAGSYGRKKDSKIDEATRCFFQAASGGLSLALANLASHADLPCAGDAMPTTVWKFYYYQWAMQIFEQYNICEGAWTTVRGRLWSNVFKFTLDLCNYKDAYCAIISNPDDDSKEICLRRFIIVLCERGPIKLLCNGEIPFVGLLDKVERELFWKAERSDVMTNPNLYKILYSFESQRNNWRKAASYMYRFTVRLRMEKKSEELSELAPVFEERIWGLSAAISALKLVNSTYAWIDSHVDSCLIDQHSPNKRARKDLLEGIVASENLSWVTKDHLDIDDLEKEYVVASAQYLLAQGNYIFKPMGHDFSLEKIVIALVLADYYEMAFTVLLKFWKGSALKRELEKVFVKMSEKCCENRAYSAFSGSGLLLKSAQDVTIVNKKLDGSIYQPKATVHWETLEVYLEKYQKLHPRLPAIVAETLLLANPQIELPLWLVRMFKAGPRTWGMTGQEADPATLLRLYIDYGRYAEATTVLLEYLESMNSTRPGEILRRKRMSAIFFPYTAIERLWCLLDEAQSSGHLVDECDRLKGLMKAALLDHLNQVKVDSEDALASGLL